MRLPKLIFALTRLHDPQAREAISVAWRERGKLSVPARASYPSPDAAAASHRATLAWVLLKMAQDEPGFFVFGMLALLTLPLFALLTLASVLLQRA